MAINRSLSRQSQHVFSRAPQINAPRSVFDRGFQHKTTFNAGFLVPFFLDEILPGDTVNVSMNAFARIATLAVPVMDNLHFETFWFFCPNRLVWDNWVKLCGEQTDPDDSVDYLVPSMTLPVGGAAEMSLADYFSIPTKVAGLSVSSLPFRMYNLIYNEWFRDENLIDSLPVPKTDTGDVYTDYQLRRRGKRHDYFTSCLPWPQKGPDVLLPLGTSAPVVGDPSSDLNPRFNFGAVERGIQALGGGTTTVQLGSALAGASQNMTWADPKLIADLTQATAATVNQLRLAFQTQKIYERDARGGTRYTEICQSHFNVINPDARLMRPEFLNSGYTPVLVNPVAQTSKSEDGQPLAQLGAYGVTAPTGHGCTYSATEHGYIIGLMCVRADLSYQQGLEKHWSRRTKLDFYWPALAHIGEQAVLNQEIFAQGTTADEDVFGYQERFAEYRYKQSQITGLFRSNATLSLDNWHLAQDFASLPVLGETFISENVPIERVEAFPDEVDFIFDSSFSYRHVRRMPVYSIPGFIDHF